MSVWLLFLVITLFKVYFLGGGLSNLHAMCVVSDVVWLGQLLSSNEESRVRETEMLRGCWPVGVAVSQVSFLGISLTQVRTIKCWMVWLWAKEATFIFFPLVVRN